MARSDKRFMVYPSPRSIEILDRSSPALNQALDCWASQVARAVGDNANDFEPSYDFTPHSSYKIIHDWVILAVSLRGKRFDPEFSKPAEFIATAVEDTER